MVSLPRIDKFLWSIRVFKTRSDATEACKGGKVLVNGLVAKASREVKVGDSVEVRKGPVRHRYQILELLANRVAAKDVAFYALDITPPEELAKSISSLNTTSVWRERGTGRPTKKERRAIDRLMGSDEEQGGGDDSMLFNPHL